MARLSVIGTNYLGATHAAGMAALGHEVIGVDIDAARVAVLNSGRAPFWEPGLDELITAQVAAGRLRFTTDHREAARGADIHFLAVGTPQRRDGGGSDLSQVHAAVDALAPHLVSRALIVGKSTVPVGTAQALRERVRAAAPAAAEVDVVWNPEFLREGHAVEDTLHPDRIVLGGDAAAVAVAENVYVALLASGVPLVRTDLPTAELVKTSANSFLAMKISFINAVAEMCDASGADVAQLAHALGLDERIGHRFLRSGTGYGGGCLPKDVAAFGARADELGAGGLVGLLDQVDAVNERARRRILDVLRGALDTAGTPGLEGRRITVLGAAFKAGTDDVRNSPGLDVAARLVDAGAEVTVHDPKAFHTAAAALPDAIHQTRLSEALRGADAVVVTAPWPTFAELDPECAARLMRGSVVVDACLFLDSAAWNQAGLVFAQPGRPSAESAVAIESAVAAGQVVSQRTGRMQPGGDAPLSAWPVPAAGTETGSGAVAAWRIALRTAS